MRKLRCVPAFVSFFFVVGCGATASYTRMGDPEYRTRRELEESLFIEDQETISNEAIKEILESKIVLPARMSIAVQELTAGRGYAGQQAEKLDIIARALKKSPRVVGVTGIPELLLRRKPLHPRGYRAPEPRIPDFREAAARLQCELVLFYRVTEDARYRNRLLRRDEAKVFTTIEGLLLHTQTGVFPFTALIDEEYEGIEARDDGLWRSFCERARREATVAALEELALQVSDFIEKTTALDGPADTARPVRATGSALLEEPESRE